MQMVLYFLLKFCSLKNLAFLKAYELVQKSDTYIFIMTVVLNTSILIMDYNLILLLINIQIRLKNPKNYTHLFKSAHIIF